MANGSPGRNGITRYRCPSGVSPMSVIGQTFGCSSRAAMTASRRSRATDSGSLSSWGNSTLMATSVLLSMSRAK